MLVVGFLTGAFGLLVSSGFTGARHSDRVARASRNSLASAEPNGPFESLESLRPELLTGVQRSGYTTLTDIQARALPPALAGRDIIGKAKTGSGKTAVFGLALLQRLDMGLASAGKPQALVLSPTRELAQQLVIAVRGLAVGLSGARVVAVTGGAKSREQRAAIAAGAHVLVGTPGRILAMLDAGYLDPCQLGTLVLDEADSLLDMGFETEVSSIIERLPQDRQTLLFSATWPEKVERLSARVQSRPTIISDGGGSAAGGGAPAQVDRALLRQKAVLIPAGVDRKQVLCAVLSACAEGHAGADSPADGGGGEPRLAVVFCETKQQCREVSSHLQARGAAALALHGDLDQKDRDKVLVRFRNGSCRILVATNVAARGLDVAGISLVVCYELSGGAGAAEAYTHRVGRTARAESVGDAISLVALGDVALGDVARGDGRPRGRGPSGGELRRLEALDDALGGAPIPRVEWGAPEYATASGGLAAGWSAMWRTLLVQGGRSEKLRAGDILGALSGGGVGVSASDVGVIEVTEKRTWVAVRRSVAASAAGALDRGKIKKSRFRVHLIEEGDGAGSSRTQPTGRRGAGARGDRQPAGRKSGGAGSGRDGGSRRPYDASGGAGSGRDGGSRRPYEASGGAGSGRGGGSRRPYDASGGAGSGRGGGSRRPYDASY
jgi:ATP-independent RNA helicase DbpA